MRRISCIASDSSKRSISRVCVIVCCSEYAIAVFKQERQFSCWVSVSWVTVRFGDLALSSSTYRSSSASIGDRLPLAPRREPPLVVPSYKYHREIEHADVSASTALPVKRSKGAYSDDPRRTKGYQYGMPQNIHDMSMNIHVTMHNVCRVLHDPTANVTLYLAFILPTYIGARVRGWTMLASATQPPALARDTFAPPSSHLVPSPSPPPQYHPHHLTSCSPPVKLLPSSALSSAAPSPPRPATYVSKLNPQRP